MDAVSFGGRVAIVTGAARGLGREHALLLAQRGAAVVVNDLGVQLDGSLADSSPTEEVVAEIQAAGGTAITDHNAVNNLEGAKRVVQSALSEFGRIDILINNAGIIRDKSFGSMTPEMFSDVLSVHLTGAYLVSAAAWPHMRERGYGRIINTTSAAGLFGNFGQANYAAAKAGVVGLTKVLAIEGIKYGIQSNAIAPVARTRMTEDLLGRLASRLEPRLVSPLVAWLAHEDCAASGNIYTVGGGRVAKVVLRMTPGWTRVDGDLTPEDIRDHFDQVEDDSVTAPAEAIADDFRALRDALSPSS